MLVVGPPLKWSTTVGRVGRGGDAEIEVEFGKVRGVAVTVGGVGFGAGVGDFGAAWGLGVLPGGDVGGSAGGDCGRVEGAAVGGWAGVLVDEEGDGVEVLCGDCWRMSWAVVMVLPGESCTGWPLT